AEYLKAKTMDTPLDNDHIRFSLLVVVGVVTGVYLVFNESSRILQVAAALVSLLLAAYLHILSARTGLMALYLFILIVLVVLLIRSGRKKVMLYIVAGMLILPAVAWFAFPTFQNRVRYMMYDLQ